MPNIYVTDDELNELHSMCNNPHINTLGIVPDSIKTIVNHKWSLYVIDMIEGFVENLDYDGARFLHSVLEVVGYKYKMNEEEDPVFIDLVLALEDKMENRETE